MIRALVTFALIGVASVGWPVAATLLPKQSVVIKCWETPTNPYCTNRWPDDEKPDP